MTIKTRVEKNEKKITNLEGQIDAIIKDLKILSHRPDKEKPSNFTHHSKKGSTLTAVVTDKPESATPHTQGGDPTRNENKSNQTEREIPKSDL